MKQTNLHLSVARPNTKLDVQRRESRDSAGYISYNLVPLYFKFLSWIFSQEARDTSEFSRRVRHLLDQNGKTFTVKYLKEAFLLTQKYLSGEEVKVTKTLPFALVGGLPRFIPGNLRKKLRKGDQDAIRLVLTSLAIFRIFKCPGILKTSTITDPFKGERETLDSFEISQALKSVFGFQKIEWLSEPKWLFLMSAGPNSSVSWKGTWLDIKAWSENPVLAHLKDFINQMGWTESKFNKELSLELEKVKSLDYNGKPLVLGKLAEKEEAAGKIRVFAITDSVTQALFKPLHDHLFHLLSKLETDGTFNQVKPLDRLLDLKRSGVLEHHKFWSYDLSAATDRLPAKLQAQIIDLLFKQDGLGDSWRRVLVEREWSTLVYSVGQPMGALSSWAMLAVTQHIVVAIAAKRVGLKNFNHYAVLGDDIVIANDLVAASYHSLMTETLGVEINLSKSLVSDTHFEYAKRLVSVDGELTPIGPKNLLILLRSPTGLVSVLKDALLKGFFLDEKKWDEVLSTSFPFYGRKVLSSMTWLVKGPFGLVPTESGLSTTLRLNNSLNPVMIDMILSSIDRTMHGENLAKWFGEVSELRHIMSNFEVHGNVDTKLVDSETKDCFTIFDSSLFFSMRSTLLDQHSRLVKEKPVRRIIFDGPLIMTNHYRADWLQTCMSYIQSKIKNWELINPVSDPFKDTTDQTISRDHTRGIRFFRKVQLDLRESISILRSRNN